MVDRHQYGQDSKVGIEGTFIPKIFKYLKPVFLIRNWKLNISSWLFSKWKVNYPPPTRYPQFQVGYYVSQSGTKEFPIYLCLLLGYSGSVAQPESGVGICWLCLLSFLMPQWKSLQVKSQGRSTFSYLTSKTATAHTENTFESAHFPKKEHFVFSLV